MNQLPVENPGSYVLNLKWVNYITDTVTSFKAIMLGNMRLNEYFSSLKGKKTQAIFSIDDILPGIMAIPLSLYLAKRRQIL